MRTTKTQNWLTKLQTTWMKLTTFEDARRVEEIRARIDEARLVTLGWGRMGND